MTYIYVRNSFVDVVSKVFTPETQTLIFNKCRARDTHIWAESEAEIQRNQAIAPPEMHYMIKLKTNLEVLTILYEEYRCVHLNSLTKTQG